MNIKKQYAKALKKLREIKEIAPEVALIHHYVCELRKPHLEIRTIETHDEHMIHELETELAEMEAKCKEFEQKYKFEKGQPRYPSAPLLKDQKAVHEYVLRMTTEGIQQIKGSGSAADMWQVLGALLVRVVNSAAQQLDFATGDAFSALPAPQKANICRNMHDALVGCLKAELDMTRATLKKAKKAKLID